MNYLERTTPKNQNRLNSNETNNLFLVFLMKTIQKYFPQLTPLQLQQFEALGPLYREWNAQINVISRKDIDNLYEHHILHLLAIAKIFSFKPDTLLLDLGSGGGFPGVPLAIMMPHVKFHLVDSIGKKMKVAQAVADGVGLTNVTTQHSRVEDVKVKPDFVICRAVTELPQLLTWTRLIISTKHRNSMPNGLIALKGNVKEEIKSIGKQEYTELTALSKFFNEPFFEEKFCLYVQS